MPYTLIANSAWPDGNVPDVRFGTTPEAGYRCTPIFTVTASTAAPANATRAWTNGTGDRRRTETSAPPATRDHAGHGRGAEPADVGEQAIPGSSVVGDGEVARRPVEVAGDHVRERSGHQAPEDDSEQRDCDERERGADGDGFHPDGFGRFRSRRALPA